MIASWIIVIIIEFIIASWIIFMVASWIIIIFMVASKHLECVKSTQRTQITLWYIQLLWYTLIIIEGLTV